MLLVGCLPWAHRSVHHICLGKWYAKFSSGKFRPWIAFIICTDQFHLPKNGRESLKLVSKNWLWRNGTRISVRKNRTTFRMYRYARKFSAGKTQNVVFRLLSNRKPFVKGNERYLLWAVWSNKVQKHHQQTSNYILNKPLPWFNKG